MITIRRMHPFELRRFPRPILSPIDTQQWALVLPTKTLYRLTLDQAQEQANQFTRQVSAYTNAVLGSFA